MIRYRFEKDLLKALKTLVPDLRKHHNEYSVYDCYSLKHNVYIELKCRHWHYDKLLIEKSKYLSLIDRAKGWKPYYICSTPEGVFSFNLDLLSSPMWQKRKMPETTYFENRDPITKVVGFLDTRKAKRLWI